MWKICVKMETIFNIKKCNWYIHGQTFGCNKKCIMHLHLHHWCRCIMQMQYTNFIASLMQMHDAWCNFFASSILIPIVLVYNQWLLTTLNVLNDCEIFSQFATVRETYNAILIKISTKIYVNVKDFYVKYSVSLIFFFKILNWSK